MTDASSTDPHASAPSRTSGALRTRPWAAAVIALAACAPTGPAPRSTAQGAVGRERGDDEPRTGEYAMPATSGHMPVNGISMYYEIHGSDHGTPLVLLHGGGSTIESTYGHLLPLFAQHRKVIALEEQGHGRTTDRDSPVRFDTSADDVAALLDKLGIQRADVMGFSNGASVALQVAIRHPALVRKLVFASSMTKKTGARPEFWEHMSKADFSDMPQSLKDAFLKVNPDPKQLRTMHDKDAERMKHFVDTSDKDVASVKVPTLIIIGDQDIVRPAHALELTQLLPQARLMILPGGHGDYLGESTVTTQGSRAPAWSAGLIDQFLDGPAGR
jgi:pimeloyl-ACP methyl ester carboxylesterase